MERHVQRWLLAWIAVLMLPWLITLLWISKTGAFEEVGQQEVNLTEHEDLETELQETEAKEAGSMQPETGELNPQINEVRVIPERRILLKQNGTYTYVNLEDYLPGIVLCQTEPEMALEALKCQAVIARTYICRLMEGRESIDEKELNLHYDRERLGNRTRRDELLTALEQCEKAVRETSHVVMKYEDRFILPMFHKISAGRTRTGEADFPYLQAAESSRDTEADGYQTEFSWSVQEFLKKIEAISQAESGTLFSEDLGSQIQIVKKDDSGYVSSIKIGVKTYSGEEIQYALGLPSSCFSIYLSQGKVHVQTFGMGHGYGLSQSGACAMAEDGWGYEEILHYYYKNISILSE